MKNKILKIGQKIKIAIGILLTVFLCFSFSENIVLTEDSEYTFQMPDFDVTLLAVSRNIEPENTGGNDRIIQWGLGVLRLKKYECLYGGFLDNYDGECGEQKISEDSKISEDPSVTPQNDGKHGSAEDVQYDTLNFDPNYSNEMNKAYQFAYHYGITTQSPISRADMNGNLTRIAMAKMLSQYAINVLGIKPDTDRQNKFNDVSEKLDSDYDNGVTLAYQLGIMGINMGDKFRPNSYVTRAEFVTSLSRLLYSMSDGKYEKTSLYYTNHMNKLYNEGIITNTDPTIFERRGYVMLMLMRSAENGGE